MSKQNGASNFQKRLKSWRKRLKWTQEQAAEFLGVSKRTYENWEYLPIRRKKFFQRIVLEKIATAK